MTRELVHFDCEGEQLAGSWGVPPDAAASYPLVILLTGDGPKGSNGQTWQQLVPMLTEQGLGTFLFDFAGLGHSPGDYKTLTLSRGCRDFRAAMEFIKSNGEHDKNRIGLIGSSFGGNVALLEAARYPEIKAVGLKSASAFLPECYQIELGAERMEEWACA